jgi:hypothetical protein
MAAMNAENSAAWDRWATVLVRRELAAHQVATVEFVVTRLQDFASLIGAETGRNERGLRAKIKELEEEVASLRADVTIQQRIASGHVIDH